MNSEEYINLKSDMTDALAGVLAKYEQSRITKWIALIEVIDAADGDRSLWQMASDETKAWDVKGMLAQALDHETGRTMLNILNQAHDEE